MAATREQAMTALLAALAAAYPFTAVKRRLVTPESVVTSGQTALVLVKVGEKIEKSSPSVPAKTTLMIRAIIYADVSNDPTAIPDATLNPIQDALEKALAPDSVFGRCTLGGLVHAAYFHGEVITAAGDRSGKCVADTPIEIILP